MTKAIKLLLAALAASLPPLAPAEELGRLFTTPEERRQLDRLSDARAGVADGGEGYLKPARGPARRWAGGRWVEGAAKGKLGAAPGGGEGDDGVE